MNREELIKLQNVQYKIMCDVADLCEKYDIKYSLAYGTLLGAIRHKGPIPWDNDIDLLMTEKEYRSFLRHASDLPEYLYIGNVGANDNDHPALIRVYLKNSLIYTNEHGKEGAFPVHIDIFVLYYAKNKNSIIQKADYKLWKFLSTAKLNDYEYGWLKERFSNSKLKTLAIDAGRIVHRYISEKDIENYIYHMYVSKKETKNYVSLSQCELLFPVFYFEGERKEKYCDRLFSVPKYSEAFLTMEYGDYMTFPPEDKRFTAEIDRWIVEYDIYDEK